MIMATEENTKILPNKDSPPKIKNCNNPAPNIKNRLINQMKMNFPSGFF
jgi:hypothetical protein